MKLPCDSVLVSTYNYASYLPRALESIRAQHEPRWEVIFDQYRGLGAAISSALSKARSPYVAYPSSDDVYYPDHLASLLECITADHDAVPAHAGVHHDHDRSAEGQIEGLSL